MHLQKMPDQLPFALLLHFSSCAPPPTLVVDPISIGIEASALVQKLLVALLNLFDSDERAAPLAMPCSLIVARHERRRPGTRGDRGRGATG